MAVNNASGVISSHPNIPVIPHPNQVDSTGIIASGDAGHVEMDVPDGMGFVAFELGKAVYDGLSKDQVSFYVRLLLPGDTTPATIPTVKTTTQGSSFIPRAFMELPRISGLKLSFVCTTAGHIIILTYAKNLAALGLGVA